MSGAAPALHGWIILDKPRGLGSTQGVSAVKRALRIGGYAKIKVGHGGTLDQLATGVLPIALGEATKLVGRMLDADKAYAFTIRFGEETDTLDAQGAVIATSPIRPTRAAIEAVLPRFTGEIEQVPPAYSALKIDGERAYARARAGETFAIPVRAVTVHVLKLLPGTGRGTAGAAGGGGGARLGEPLAESPLPHAAHGPPPRAGEELEEVTLTASVTKGTYIRSLARDIAHALGTVGHVTMLRRTKAGPFTLEQAISLDKLDQAAKARALEGASLPLTAGLDGIPVLAITPDQAQALREGRRPVGIAARSGLNLACLRDVPVALVEAIGPELQVTRGFNLPMPKDDAT